MGQVLVAKLVLASRFTGLHVDLSNGDIAFVMSFWIWSRDVVKNTIINGSLGLEEFLKPHFNFTPGQEVEIVCIITQVGYTVYIDKILFFIYHHRLPSD